MTPDVQIPTLADCQGHGIEPVDLYVLVAPAIVPEKKGSIILPSDSHDREEFRNMRGRVLAVSPMAFAFDEWPAFAAHLKPRIGDVILHEEFAGRLVKGADGRDYRLMKDRAVMAVLERGAVREEEWLPANVTASGRRISVAEPLTFRPQPEISNRAVPEKSDAG